MLLATADSLPAETADALERGVVTESIVVGGSEAVGETVVAELTACGHGPRRVFGEDRYATSAAVHDEAVDAGLDASVLWLATGADWPDALTAGATVGARGETLMLVDGSDLDGSPGVRDVLAQDPRVVDDVRIIGGPQVISRDVEAEIADLLARE